MRDRDRVRLVAALALTSGLASTTCIAQTGATEQVIVYARQRSENVQDIPAAVTAIPADELERLALNNLEQVSNIVPNLRISYGSSGASSEVFLRGIGTGAGSAGFSSAIGIVIDGVHYERGRWIQQGYFDLDQIEVLKGPQVLYFGKNNPAGLIVLHSREPGDTLSVNVKAGYEYNANESYVEAGISAPLSDRFAVRFSGRQTSMDGWIDNTAQQQLGVDPLGFDIPGAADARLPGTEDTQGRLTAVWTPTDRFKATLRLGSARNEDAGMVATSGLISCFGPGGDPQPIFGVPSPFDDCQRNFDHSRSALPAGLLAPEPAVFGDGTPFTDYESNNVSLELNWDLGAYALTSITGDQHYDVVSLDNFSYADDGQIAGFEATDYDQLSQEIRLISQFDGALNFLVGALVTRGDLEFRNSSRIAPLPPDSTTGRLFSWDKTAIEDTTSWSLYADVIWDVNDQWEFSAGARYSDEQRDSSIRIDYLHEILLALGALSPQGFQNLFEDDDISPQISVAYRPRDEMMFFAAYREGFKSGGFDASFLLGPGSTLDDLTFNSEKASGYEFGFKSELLDRTFQLDATAYSFEYRDLQVQQFNAATTQFNIDNAAKATTTGIEADFNWRAMNAFALRGAINYNEAEYDEFLASCYAGQSVEAGCSSVPNPVTGGFSSQNLAGQPLAVAPDLVFNLGADFDVDFGGWLASFSLDARHSGSYNAAVSKIPEANQPSFAAVDTTIRLLSPNQAWELSLIGRNLGNEKIAVQADDRPLTGGASGFLEGDARLGLRSDAFVRLQRGRQIWLTIAYRFQN
jgi:iron complex outermembrane receptor protein